MTMVKTEELLTQFSLEMLERRVTSISPSSVYSAVQWGKSPIFSVRLFSPLISYSESSLPLSLSLSTPLPMYSNGSLGDEARLAREFLLLGRQAANCLYSRFN